MIDQHFVEDQANALARKALEFILKPKARGERPPPPGKALSSASWATIGGKFRATTRARIKKRARAILAKLLKTN